MKKVSILFVALMGMVAASCSNDESLGSSVNLSSEQNAQAPVTVRVADFSVSQEEFPDVQGTRGTTRAAQSAEAYTGVKAITLAFYKGSTEAYKVTQLKGSLEEGETFGEFSLSLPMGSYTMVVLGHGLNDGEPAVTLTSPTTATFGEYPARETFAYTQAVNITNSDAVDVSATLNRIISKLHVVSSDNRTSDAVKVRMTFAAGGKAFNPTTGAATSDTGFSNTVTTSTAAGVASLSNSYLFLATDEQTMDVTIETLDADDNVLFSKTVEDVPFKRNRVTKLTGKMYSDADVSGAFQLETAWIDQYEDTF